MLEVSPPLRAHPYRHGLRHLVEAHRGAGHLHRLSGARAASSTGGVVWQRGGDAGGALSQRGSDAGHMHRLSCARAVSFTGGVVWQRGGDAGGALSQRGGGAVLQLVVRVRGGQHVGAVLS